jgi:two-component system, sensor histidine kinase
MFKQFTVPNDRLATREEITSALKVHMSAAMMGHALFVAGCYFTYRMFEALVPSARIGLWAICTSIFLVVWLALEIAVLLRRPTTRELIRIWAPTAQLVLLGSDAVVVATIWLFLPYADQALTLMMMVFYASHIPTQVLCSPENTEVNRIGIVAVLGSAIACLVLKGSDVELMVAAFLAVFSMVLYFVSDVIRQSTRDAAAERNASDAAERGLQMALTAVAGERDAKTRFIAAASHDLGQPLQAANLFFDQAMRAPDESSRALAAQGVQRAFSAAEQLLSHMLNHLRLEADAVSPLLSHLEISQCFNRLQNQYLPMARNEGIELRVALAKSWLWLDPALLDRAIGNLIHNAIVHSGAKKILICCRNGGARKLRLYVIDNGVGIGSADAKHIFQDFYRGSDSRARVKGGFGLGLSSVRRIAELMGGVAGLDLRWIHGSAFYLEFPQRDSASAQNN